MDLGMGRVIKIGNGQAFWGDRPGGAPSLLRQQGDLDFLTLDYLAELSMGILAHQREKDSSLGYARDVVEMIVSLVPLWKKGSRCKVVTNGGGLNPRGCALACLEVLKNHGLPLKVGVVSGDDVTHHYDAPYLTANAYLGANSIADLLQEGAHIVITGRVADPSLVVGPCMATFGWKDHDRLATATVAGHLIECGSQVTGGISTDWLSLTDPFTIPFPIVEISEEGGLVVTKPPNTGGEVSLQTVKEQLLYEMGDPSHYLSPDVTVSITDVELQDLGNDRIAVLGVKGSPPPPQYKVGAISHEGFRAEGTLVIYGHKAVEKGEMCGKVIIEHLKQEGFNPKCHVVECLGCGDVVPGVGQKRGDLIESVLRVAVADPSREVVVAFTKEIAAMVTGGPPGVTGYATGRPVVYPFLRFSSHLLERTSVEAIVEVLE